ncbi:DsbA family protein [Hymenobacter daeguensis]
MTPDAPAANLPELLYIQDPLCGWSYGMSPVINRIQQEFAGRVDVAVLCGGMVKGEDVEPISDTWQYLEQSLAEVEKVTGVPFGAAFKALGEAGDYRYDSEPPSRAIGTFRHLTQDPARAVAFAQAVQTALFRDGQDLNDPATYNALLELFGVEGAAFQERFAAPEAARATQQEFAAVARIGIEGFPTAVVRIGEQGYVLARGYQPYEQLRAGLELLLQQEGA